MGGIPGTSKRCIICRRRKIKCDLQHPICIRCSRSWYQCGGYSTRTVYVHRHAGFMGISDRENAYEVGGDILLFDPYPGKCLVCVSMMFQCTSGSIKSWTAHISGAMSVFNSEDLLPVEGNKTLTCFKIIERMATGGYVSQNKAYESLPPSLEDSQTAYMCELA
ncbi:hypothetical protein BKA61DRAFT_571144 [Leptodontidium sp. MPI-SDFR-AT-0119]|nr:hypothetical protein BKA61DRAFT_571144 [Leptodontidium sp. MPI-SDFR-AT-0119]